MKNTLFTLLLALLVYLVIEIVALAAYWVKFGDYSLYTTQHSKLAAIKKLNDSGVFVPEQAIKDGVTVKPILHPYIGYTVDGKIKDPQCRDEVEQNCIKRIKVDTDLPLEKRAHDKLIVGVVGGSFADGTIRGGSRDFVRKELNSLPAFANKKITLYNMAGGGYKQPQQLMHVNYMYALGAEFDIIINLDGFNEMAASFYGWRDSQLHPAFPVSWNSRVASGITQQQMDLYASKKSNLQAHAQMAKFGLIEGIRYSPFMNFIWKLLDARYLQITADINLQSSQQDKNTNRDFKYEALGPDFDISDPAALFDYTVDLWANSSMALQALANGHNALYFHFIQPNQYIEGSKPLSDFERKNAVLANGGYGNVYKMAYPKLSAKAQKLATQGVNVIDLTNMFANNSATLYIDNCCHLNSKGYDLVAREIVRHIGLAVADTHNIDQPQQRPSTTSQVSQ